MIELIYILQIICLCYLGKKIGYDSGPFINYGLIVFGQLYLYLLLVTGFVDVVHVFNYLIASFLGLLLFYLLAKKIRPTENKPPQVKITKILKICFVLYTLIGILQMYLSLKMGGAGMRLAAFKNILPLTILHDLLQGGAFFYIATMFETSRLRAYTLTALTSIILLATGSKQAVLIFLLEIVFIARLLQVQRRPSFVTAVLFGVLGFVASALIFYRNDGSLTNLANFLQYRGDIYGYLFALDLRTSVMNQYDATTYFLHHLYRLFGSRIYDGPIGTLLVVNAADSPSPLIEAVGGPITPFFVVVDILAKGPSTFIFILSSILVGSVSVFLFNRGLKIFTNYKNNVFNILIGYWYMQSWYLYTDPTVFSYRMTPVFLGQLIFLGLSRYIKKS